MGEMQMRWREVGAAVLSVGSVFRLPVELKL